MPKGKPWTKKEVEKLRKLLEAKEPLEVIAAELRGTRDAVKKKCKRLSLVVGAKGYRTTTLKLQKELPTIQEALKILAAEGTFGLISLKKGRGIEKLASDKFLKTALLCGAVFSQEALRLFADFSIFKPFSSFFSSCCCRRKNILVNANM